MQRIFRLALIATFVIGTVSVASAQDWRRDPHFGDTVLNAGFSVQAIYLTAGGGSDPQNVGGFGYTDGVDGTQCVGFVARSPDFRFQYSGGGSFLRFFAVTHEGADAMILINDPNETWRCNDDSHGTYMPTVDVNSPPAGQYDLWIGTYDGSANNPTTMYVTEGTAHFPGSASNPPLAQRPSSGSGGGGCTNTCPTSNDFECDDGGPGSLYDVCALGTDCADCGPRGGGGGSASGGTCDDSCPYAYDGECDDGGAGSVTSACGYGTDCGDCGPRDGGGDGDIGAGWEVGGGGGFDEPGCEDTCAYAYDGECDDGGPGALTEACEYGTDCSDCGAR